MTFCDLETEEPFDELASDAKFERDMKMASLSLLRAMEREKGLYPLVPPPVRGKPITARRPPIREEALGKGIIAAVAEAYEMPVSVLIGRRRARHYICARSVAAKLLRDQTWQDGTPRFSTPQIGRMMGGRDHTTIIYSLGAFALYCEQYPFMRDVYDALADGAE